MDRELRAEPHRVADGQGRIDLRDDDDAGPVDDDQVATLADLARQGLHDRGRTGDHGLQWRVFVGQAEDTERQRVEIAFPVAVNVAAPLQILDDPVHLAGRPRQARRDRGDVQPLALLRQELQDIQAFLQRWHAVPRRRVRSGLDGFQFHSALNSSA